MAAPLNGAAITSFTVIDVVDSDDVVLAEIAAGLNLDQLHVDLAWIGEAVRRANRQVDRFVLVHERHFVIKRDLGGARTTTQCSARWWCFCSERRPPGRTTMRLTW